MLTRKGVGKLDCFVSHNPRLNFQPSILGNTNIKWYQQIHYWYRYRNTTKNSCTQQLSSSEKLKTWPRDAHLHLFAGHPKLGKTKVNELQIGPCETAKLRHGKDSGWMKPPSECHFWTTEAGLDFQALQQEPAFKFWLSPEFLASFLFKKPIFQLQITSRRLRLLCAEMIKTRMAKRVMISWASPKRHTTYEFMFFWKRPPKWRKKTYEFGFEYVKSSICSQGLLIPCYRSYIPSVPGREKVQGARTIQASLVGNLPQSDKNRGFLPLNRQDQSVTMKLVLHDVSYPIGYGYGDTKLTGQFKHCECHKNGIKNRPLETRNLMRHDAQCRGHAGILGEPYQRPPTRP